MTEAALSAGVLWLGFRGVTLVAGHLLRVNVGAYSLGSVRSKPKTVPLGCGCQVWMKEG